MVIIKTKKELHDFIEADKQNYLRNSVKERFTDLEIKANTWGADMLANFADGIKSKIQAVVNTVQNVASKIKGLIGFSEPTDPKSPLHNFHTFAPDMMDLFIKGVNDNKGRLVDTVANAFDFENAIVRPYDIDVNGTSAGNTSGGNVYNININQPIDTPDEIARIIRTEAQYGLIGGAAIE
jgi:hypothetical protein